MTAPVCLYHTECLSERTCTSVLRLTWCSFASFQLARKVRVLRVQWCWFPDINDRLADSHLPKADLLSCLLWSLSQSSKKRSFWVPTLMGCLNWFKPVKTGTLSTSRDLPGQVAENHLPHASARGSACSGCFCHQPA